MACEARWCLQQPKEARLAYYRMVEAKRGTESAQALIDAVKAEHQSGLQNASDWDRVNSS